MMSKVLEVTRSGYYKWLTMCDLLASKKVTRENMIKEQFEISMQTYGSPRIAMSLKREGIIISKTTVARVMQTMQIKARDKKKFAITTDSKHNYNIPENLLDRNFDVDKVNSVWVSDITYIRVGDTFNYLTTVIDLADRMIVGWHLSDNMTTEQTSIAAFKKAVNNRGITKLDNLMFHSDRGVQYACHSFTKLLTQYNCTQSMSRKGNCWDNAVAESFFKTIKIETLDKYRFQSSAVLNQFIFRYIDGWYNTQRLNSSLGYISPLEAFYQKFKKNAA